MIPETRVYIFTNFASSLDALETRTEQFTFVFLSARIIDHDFSQQMYFAMRYCETR